ncbi:hypothetical protein [Bacillus marasmi]|uniref:hypothetical protein n=1 Tax=Bacillus marasmi TaxID=1926279 RepID=UPI0011CB0F7C|nr:hypothetical protein [Bacillus marasmi]
MKVNNKAKWIVGITGAAFSAFVIGQLNDNPNPVAQTSSTVTSVEINDSMSKREKELVKLDWNNFSIQENDYQGGNERDRTTRRT